MCAVSMVVDSWQTPGGPNYIPGFAPQAPLPQRVTPDLALQMLEVLNRLDALDKRLGALECSVKEADKAKIVRKLKARAKAKKDAS